jgi:hypothetical protein
VSNDGAAQLNDVGYSRLIDVQGFDEPVIRDVRFTAPELMPIDRETSDIPPSFQSEIFSLAMLLLQVCRCRCPHLVQMLIKGSSCAAISRT